MLASILTIYMYRIPYIYTIWNTCGYEFLLLQKFIFLIKRVHFAMKMHSFCIFIYLIIQNSLDSKRSQPMRVALLPSANHPLHQYR